MPGSRNVGDGQGYNLDGGNPGKRESFSERVVELFDPGECAFVGRGISTADAAAAAAVPVTTVRTWVNGGTVTPTFRPDRARQGAAYYWTAADVVGLRALQSLRQHGCPTRNLTIAWRLVRDWGIRGCDPDQLLVWQEGEPRLVNYSDLDALLSVCHAPVAVVTIPLHAWLADGVRAPTVEFDLREARIRPASSVAVHDAAIGAVADNRPKESPGLFTADAGHPLLGE